jgi:glutaredoxin
VPLWRTDPLPITNRRVFRHSGNQQENGLETKARVVLYSRPGCHLCEEIKTELTRAGCADLYSLEEIDIESDPQLLERYRYEIPVICIDGVEAFRHRLRADEFREYVTSLAGKKG